MNDNKNNLLSLIVSILLTISIQPIWSTVTKEIIFAVTFFVLTAVKHILKKKDFENQFLLNPQILTFVSTVMLGYMSFSNNPTNTDTIDITYFPDDLGITEVTPTEVAPTEVAPTDNITLLIPIEWKKTNNIYWQRVPLQYNDIILCSTSNEQYYKVNIEQLKQFYTAKYICDNGIVPKSSNSAATEQISLDKIEFNNVLYNNNKTVTSNYKKYLASIPINKYNKMYDDVLKTKLTKDKITKFFDGGDGDTNTFTNWRLWLYPKLTVNRTKPNDSHISTALLIFISTLALILKNKNPDGDYLSFSSSTTLISMITVLISITYKLNKNSMFKDIWGLMYLVIPSVVLKLVSTELEKQYTNKSMLLHLLNNSVLVIGNASNASFRFTQIIDSVWNNYGDMNILRTLFSFVSFGVAMMMYYSLKMKIDLFDVEKIIIPIFSIAFSRAMYIIFDVKSFFVILFMIIVLLPIYILSKKKNIN